MSDRALVLTAVDEHGEVQDRLSCRWLGSNIRRMGASTLEVERKLNELAKLEDFLEETGCEVIALGVCDLVCRRLQAELEHVGTAMAIRRNAAEGVA
eukprot:6806333-Prymnesium_polylepis.1